MSVVNFDLTQIYLFVFTFSVETGVEVIDDQVLPLLRFVEGHDQRRQQDQVGEHGDH